jgi:methionyl-tRNA formyltransferase
LHWIDEVIDTGEIIARENFEITPGMTQQNVLLTTAEIGAKLLHHAGKQLAAGVPLTPIAPHSYEQDHYYPMPGSDAFETYFKRRRFFRIRDVIRSILRRDKKSQIMKYGTDKKQP